MYASLHHLLYPLDSTNSENPTKYNWVSFCPKSGVWVVVGRLIANSIARLALGRVPINRTCHPSLDLFPSDNENKHDQTAAILRDTLDRQDTLFLTSGVDYSV